MVKVRAAAWVFVFVGAIVTAAAASPAGYRQAAFGKRGLVLTSIDEATEANALVRQPDGKLVAAGGANSGFALARYRPNGQVDRSFGSDGIVTTASEVGIATDDSGALALALQPDGKIVAAGSSDDEKFILVRYNADGSLDASFGGRAVVSGPAGSVRALVVQPDGKIVAAGSSGDFFALARYERNGRLDPSFGTGGKVVTHLRGDIAAVVLQPDGKIVAAGREFPGRRGATARFALARYQRNGSLDRSFGTGGVSTASFSKFASAEAQALILQPDGKLVAAGGASGAGDECTPCTFALARFTSSGQLDRSFGDQGTVTAGIGHFASAYGLALERDGKIVASGRTWDEIAVMRFDPNGRLDSTFGHGGKLTTADTADGGADATAVVVQPGGRIVTAGAAYNGGFVLARYRPDGRLDG